MKKEMTYKGFTARLMEADRLEGDDIHRLPPGMPLTVYHADEFLKLPDTWMKGSGVFVVPVKPNKGLWFDWRENEELNTAIIPTIKGCSPLTGMQTSGFHLERYDNKCPKHNCDFMGDRFCPECNYKWQPQNYVAHPNTLWWDIFVSGEDGVGRQFIFSEESIRDIPAHLIGKENTVPAFGFAFFTPKKPREARPVAVAGYKIIPETEAPADTTAYIHFSDPVKKNLLSSYLGSGSQTKFYSPGGGAKGPIGGYGGQSLSYNSNEKGIKEKKHSFGTLSSTDSVHSRGIKIPEQQGNYEKIKKGKEPKEVSIGAGGKIEQKLEKDPFPLDSWKETPDAVMTIYFVFQEKFKELKAGGMRNLEGQKEGMLDKLPVG